MTIDKAQIDMLLAVVNFLLVGGIKNLAAHFRLVIEDKLTLVLAGVMSAVLVALVVIYVQGQPLTLSDVLHWVFVFLGSLGIYQSIITNAKATARATTQALNAEDSAITAGIAQALSAPPARGNTGKPVALEPRIPPVETHL